MLIDWSENLLRRPRDRWEYGIKTSHTGEMEWIHLAKESVRWQVIKYNKMWGTCRRTAQRNYVGALSSLFADPVSGWGLVCSERWNSGSEWWTRKKGGLCSLIEKGISLTFARRGEGELKNVSESRLELETGASSVQWKVFPRTHLVISDHLFARVVDREDYATSDTIVAFFKNYL